MKSKIVNWGTNWGKYGWKCEEWDGNAGAGNQLGNAQSGWKCKNCGESGCYAENQGGNLIIAVEMTQNSNGNNKFKE